MEIKSRQQYRQQNSSENYIAQRVFTGLSAQNAEFNYRNSILLFRGLLLLCSHTIQLERIGNDEE